MTTPPRFDYTATGLPQNPQWMAAVKACHSWLQHHMSMFGDKGIANFMHNQPVAAAKRLLDTCHDISDDAITAVLLGPARSDILAHPHIGESVFGRRAMDLFHALNTGETRTPSILADMNRVNLAEGISGMNDQIIGRARIDRHHAVRWNMLRSYESLHADTKGQNPALDTAFADCLIRARASLEALDAAAKTQKPKR